MVVETLDLKKRKKKKIFINVRSDVEKRIKQRDFQAGFDRNIVEAFENYEYRQDSMKAIQTDPLYKLKNFFTMSRSYLSTVFVTNLLIHCSLVLNITGLKLAEEFERRSLPKQSEPLWVVSQSNKVSSKSLFARRVKLNVNFKNDF